MLDEFQKDFDNIRIKTLLSGEYDSENAIIKLNGAGRNKAVTGVACFIVCRSRWVDKKGFSLEVLDYLDGDEAGIKSVTFQVNGTNAYGYLKSEKEFTVLCISLLLMRQTRDFFRILMCRISRIWM